MAAAWTLAFDGIVSIATAVIFAYVGSLMARREVPDADSRVAMRLFAAWWFSLAAVTLGSGILGFLALSGVLTLGLYTGIAYVLLVPLTVALWGLLYYLVYIYTGNSKWLTPLTGAYLVIYFVLNYLVYYLHPTAFVVGDWSVTAVYERELTPVLGALSILLLLGPVLLAALAYGSLFFSARQRSVRYRVALVSGAFLLWFGSSGLAGLTGLNDATWWPLASRIVSLTATFMVLAAYRPPRALVKRFALEPVPVTGGSEPERRLKGSIVAVLLRKPREAFPSR